MDLKEKVLQAIPIENYIGKYVTLKKQGRSLSGLCPFHKEKTPSFSVSPDKGLYYCFGCQAGGNLITFAIEYHGIDFRGALQLLAREAGIDPAQYSRKSGGSGSPDKTAQEKKALALACDFFTQNLYANRPDARAARAYAHGRGLNDKILNHFQVGFAPRDGNKLLEFLGQSGVSVTKQQLAQIALFRLYQEKNRPEKFYPFFRDRLIFPIHNPWGDVIGFGGRALSPDDKPKYLNSTNSAYFDKSRVLYNAHRAGKAIREQGFVLVAEGYMDVIGLTQHGLANVVAPLGTAVTNTHLENLGRQTREIIFIMDGDRAGRQSALKGVRLAQNLGLESRVVLLPEGEDPFDFCQNHEETEVLAHIDKAMSGGEFRLKMAITTAFRGEGAVTKLEHSFSDWMREARELEANTRILQNLFEDWREIPSQSQVEYLAHQAAGYLNLDFGNIWSDWNRYTKQSGTLGGRLTKRTEAMGSPGGKQGGEPPALSREPGPGRARPLRLTKKQETELRCEWELAGLFSLAPDLGRYWPRLEVLNWQDPEIRRFFYFIGDRLQQGESIALRDLFGTAIGDDFCRRLARYQEMETGTHDAEAIFWELVLKKESLSIDRQSREIMERLNQAGLSSGERDRLRGELIRLKTEKLKRIRPEDPSKGT